jgi:hypothetical protein
MRTTRTENEERTRQALRGIKHMLTKDVRQMAVVSGV